MERRMSSQLLTPLRESVCEPALAEDHQVECRVYERHSCGVAFRCQPAAMLGKDDRKWSGTIADASIGGVGLILERRFEKGTGLAIELPGHDKNDSDVVLAKVMHVSRRSDNTWMMGCQFLSELSEDELQRLLFRSPQALSTTPDRSANPRIVPVHLIVEIAEGETIDCTIPDFGTTKCRWPLAPGAIGALKGVDRTGNPWKLAVKVRLCRLEGRNWKLVCRLTSVQPDAELRRAVNALIMRGSEQTNRF
jgi:hypothetical protein